MPLIVQDTPDVLSLSLAQRTLNAFLEQRRVASDRTKRGAKLVADHVHVSAFRCVRFLGGPSRFVGFDARTISLLERCLGGGKGFRQRFRLGFQRFLGAKQLLLGALPRYEDAVSGAPRYVVKGLLFVVVQISGRKAFLRRAPCRARALRFLRTPYRGS